MRTKGAKDKRPRKLASSSSPERMRQLAAARRLPEPQVTVKVLRSAKDALFAKVAKNKRTMFATRALMDALASV